MKYLLDLRKVKERKLRNKVSVLGSYKEQIKSLENQLEDLNALLSKDLKESKRKMLEGKKKRLLMKREVLESAIKNITSEVDYLKESLENIKEKIIESKLRELETKKIRVGDCVKYRIRGEMTLSSSGVVKKVFDKYLIVKEDDGLFRKVTFEDWIIWKSKGC